MALITEDHLEQQVLDQVVLFQAADGQVTLDVRLEAENHRALLRVVAPDALEDRRAVLIEVEHSVAGGLRELLDGSED